MTASFFGMRHLHQGDQHEDLKVKKIYYKSISSILAANGDLLFCRKCD